MKNVIKIISKQEFTSLYRFGKIPYTKSSLIDSDKVSKLLFDAFKALPSFEGDEEYLIIHIDADSVSPSYILITDLVEIIPLTRAAKKSFEIKFDSRLNFSEAIYEDVIQQVETSIEIEDKLEGSKSLVNLLLKNNKTAIDEKVISDAYFSRYKGLKSNQIKSDFFTHLLVYERYEFFPNTEYGYFYDIGEVFAHFKERDSFKGTGFYNFLENNKAYLKEKKLSEIIEFVERSEEIDSFKNLLTSNSVKMYLTGVFYLKYKEELVGKDSIFQTGIPKIMEWVLVNKQYLQENTDALFLLGGFFGFKKFYDDYYDSLNLRIFKKKFGINKVSIEKAIKQVSKKGKKEKVEFENIEVGTLDKDNFKNAGISVEKIKNNKISKGEKGHLELQNTTLQDSNEAINDDAIITQEPIDVLAVVEPVIIEISEIDPKLIAKKGIEDIFEKYNTDELKLSTKVISELAFVLTPVSLTKKVTKTNIIDIINGIFSDNFECPNTNIIRKKNSTDLFNSTLSNKLCK